MQAANDAHRAAEEWLGTWPGPRHGLTLRFYPAFEICTATLPKYKQRVARELADDDRWAIHTLVSQAAGGALTLGDSHEYGLAVDAVADCEVALDAIESRIRRGEHP